ncbi:MAG: hypothetical protein HQK86_03215 [Nitrospinae bacterium]|nr:hypothetical protein [Nitrospinota bacterium]
MRVKISIAERLITVRELTVREMREWFQELKTMANTEQVDVIGNLLFEGISLETMRKMTNLAPDEISQFTPSELSSLLEKLKEVNPHFFGVLAHLKTLGAS